MALTVDTRTATEYGVVRTFGQGDFQFNNFGSTNPAGHHGFPRPALHNALISTAGGGYVAVEMVFIQFAGFTFGKSASAFAAPWHGYPGNNNSFLMGGHDTVTGVNNIQYTAQFGNGVSATIGLDDPTVFHRTNLLNLGVGATPAGFALNVNPTAAVQTLTAASVCPEIVGNFRVDQAWGLFQLSAAVMKLTLPTTCWALAVFRTTYRKSAAILKPSGAGRCRAALQIKNIPTGAGDDFKISAVYAQGKTKDVISTSGGSPSFAMFGGTGRAGAYQSVGFGQTSDGVFLPGFLTGGATGGIKLTEVMGCSWCVQPQLGSLLVVQPLGKLRCG